MPELSPRARTAIWRGVIALAVAALLVVVIGAPFVLTAADHAANNSDRVAEGNELNSCASSFHALLIDRPNTAFEVATGNVAAANAEVSKVVAQGLKAEIDNSPQDLAAADSALGPLTQAIDAATSVQMTSAGLVNKMAAQYQTLSTMRRTNPDKYLAACAKLPSS